MADSTNDGPEWGVGGGKSELDPNTDRMVFPVREEQLEAGKRVVDTGSGIRLHKTVTAEEKEIDLPLQREELLVERVPAGTMVADEEDAKPYYDGDTLVVPVLEEVLVIEKRLRIREELRITRQRREMHAPESVVVRKEEISVEQFHASHGQSNNGSVQPLPGKPGVGRSAD